MSRRTRRRHVLAAPPPAPARIPPWPLLALFAVALLVRVLFWRATPDSAWGYSALYKGDAPLWLEYAQALHDGQPFELGLPIHPPGTGYLLAALWNGRPSGIGFLRLAFAAQGALVVALAALAAWRSFGARVALGVGTLCCFSTGLLLLSGSAGSETPYLVLVLAAFSLFEGVRRRPRWRPLAALSALHGLACLFRVEHALFFTLFLGLLAGVWLRAGCAFPRVVRGLAVALACFLLPLVPWQAKAWGSIGRFNTEEPRRGPAEEAAVAGLERATAHLRWEPGAERRRRELPAFCRRTSAGFVAATVAWRGGTVVREEDFRILDEAFGDAPRPLGRFPFVSAYGPLNFALANHPAARGGFDRAALEAPPPLLGGASRYPPLLVQGLPPERLTFDYPPHVRLFNDGYALGWGWIREAPGRFSGLALRRLGIFWSGAALGFTGHGFPLGASGVRRAVDLAVPRDGPLVLAWRAGLLLCCLGGLALAWRHPALWPWLLFALAKVAASVAFFGYARLGATAFPVVALLLVLCFGAVPLPRSARLGPWLLAAAVLTGVALEAARLLFPPTITLDGQVAGRHDPFPPDLHRDHRVDLTRLGTPGAAR